MTDTQQNFLGIPVEGDITRGNDRKPQRPLEEFAPILQAVLDDPTIVELGWRQYTPYFNDGDPCVFSVYEPWARVDDDDPEADHEYLGIDAFSMSYYNRPIGKRPYEWINGPNGREKVYGDYEGPDEARYDRLVALGEAVDSGEFDDVLLAAFGDHAEVTVRRDGIVVESYDHD